jgi:propionyl-CoA synthetase
VTTSSPTGIPDQQLFSEIQKLVRSQVGPIASLGGMIQGRGMIPKTRSGKTLRRVLRELLENGVRGEFDAVVSVPSTVEDERVVGVAREMVRGYFMKRGVVEKAKL